MLSTLNWRTLGNLGVDRFLPNAGRKTESTETEFPGSWMVLTEEDK